MKEHFWCEKSLVANINFDHVVIQCFVHKLSEFGRLNNLSSLGVHFFFIKLTVFFQYVVTHIAILFFDSCSNFHWILCWELFSSVFHHLQNYIGHVATSNRYMLYTACDYVRVTNRENVRYTITSIYYSAGEFLFHTITLLFFLFFSLSYLSIQC